MTFLYHILKNMGTRNSMGVNNASKLLLQLMEARNACRQLYLMPQKAQKSTC
jgi:hypothetical protein